jgi:hypothetical protein
LRVSRHGCLKVSMPQPGGFRNREGLQRDAIQSVVRRA